MTETPLNDERHEFFMRRLTNLPLAKRIVYGIANDLGYRRGLWGEVDADIQEEILQSLIDITEQELAKNTS